MTSNRKAKKMSAMEAHRAVNRQFYRRQEVLDYPDIIHVKNDDPHRSDVVCFRTFGQAYMDVVPHPAMTEDGICLTLPEYLIELVERSTQPNTQPDNKPDTANSRLLDEDTYKTLMRLGILDTSVRSYNRGASDYSRHIIQPWTIWQDYNLNPWDADIVKRILRTKQGDSRRLDYEKIIHICEERIRQIDMEG